MSLTIHPLEPVKRMSLDGLAEMGFDAFVDVDDGIRFYRTAPSNELQRHGRETWWFGSGRVACVVVNYGQHPAGPPFHGWRASTSIGGPGRHEYPSREAALLATVPMIQDRAKERVDEARRALEEAIRTEAALSSHLKDPAAFAVTVRPATNAELESVGADEHASVIDGAALVLLGGRIIAVTNEYGTAHIVDDKLVIEGSVLLPGPGRHEVNWPTAEQIEVMVNLATNLWEAK